MTQYTAQRFQVLRRLTALGLLASTVSGCSFTQSSTTVRSLPEPPVEHLRLTRADSSPVSGTFEQNGHAVVGQLTLGAGCASESNQTVRRQSITETRTNRTTAITWVVLGGVLTAVGAGFLVASQSADKQVTCGNDLSSAPKEGDECHSQSGILSEAGFSTLLSGLAIGTGAGIFLARKPQTETADLPSQQLTRVTAPVACGNTEALAGLVVALELPAGGRWTGRAASDGSVRIDINEKISLPAQMSVPVVVESVPPSLAGLVTVGAGVGKVILSGAHTESPRRKLASNR